jgi:hypothetical protein
MRFYEDTKTILFCQNGYFCILILYMETRLAINKETQLVETKQPLLLKLIAQFISYVFHPVFVPLYVVAFLVFVHPYLYAGFSTDLKFVKVMGFSFICFTFFPIITVLLLKGLQFIDSIYLHTQRDRIIPIAGSMIWYFWVWHIWRNFGKTEYAIDMPVEAVKFALASFISTIIALMANIKMKISLHAIAMGVMLAFMCLLAFSQELNFGVYLSIAVFITGIVCTARLIVSDHRPVEVYGGLLAGIASMLVAWWLM